MAKKSKYEKGKYSIKWANNVTDTPLELSQEYVVVSIEEMEYISDYLLALILIAESPEHVHQIEYLMDSKCFTTGAIDDVEYKKEIIKIRHRRIARAVKANPALTVLMQDGHLSRVISACVYLFLADKYATPRTVMAGVTVAKKEVDLIESTFTKFNVSESFTSTMCRYLRSVAYEGM